MGNCNGKSTLKPRTRPTFNMLCPDGRAYMNVSKLNDGTILIYMANDQSFHMSQSSDVDTIVDIILHYANTILAETPDNVLTFECDLYPTKSRCDALYSSKHVDEMKNIVRKYVEAIRACETVKI